MVRKLDTFDALIKNLARNGILDIVAKTLKELVVRRTKLGRGVAQQKAKAKKLKPLSDDYKKQRRVLRKKGVLSKDTTPARSNFTRTGDTLDTMQHEVLSDNKVRIFVDKDNEKKIRDQIKQGRVIMNVSDREYKEITKLLKEQIINKIKGL